MADGKLVSILTGIGAQNCHACLATPSMMNKIDAIIARPVQFTEFTTFLSVLHAWIRSLELCLNVAYRLTIKRAYTQYTKKQKNDMEKQKAEIKKNLKDGLGIKVGTVKPGGHGNTNDGNLARKFFQKPETTAALTGQTIHSSFSLYFVHRSFRYCTMYLLRS